MWLNTDVRRGPHTASAGEVGDEVGALSVMSDSACMHRWRIDEPNGEFATGKCLLCGAERAYPAAH